ncbi:ABC transporter ATP-binding protein/permease [Aestuariivirga sp.]|uniref:ABC transporter ATP-binding protein/permease n=1 Tax=Aestuariivirga sp. TaxID=2650926 RepID=UPI0039E35741
MPDMRSKTGDVLDLVLPFWLARENRFPLLLLLVLVALNLLVVWLYVLFNGWNRDFFDALQLRDRDAFWHQIWVFSLIAAAIIVFSVARQYLLQWLQFRWREDMTAKFQNAWLGQSRHYRLQVQGLHADNPDQRIADDTRAFTQASLKLAMDLLVNGATLVSFIGILWGLSRGTVVPGELVWVAIAYAAVGSVLTYFIGRPLSPLNYEQERLNADFRFALMRVRDNSQPVAVSQGEGAEGARLAKRFAAIARNWAELIARQAKLTAFTVFYAQIAAVVPVLAVAPAYLSGEIPLGAIFQTGNAFAQVYGALSWFVNSFVAIAEWRAATQRLTDFRKALDEVKPVTPPAVSPRGIAVTGLSLALPGGRTLFKGLNAQFDPGSSTLITGPSGCGKSTLFSALGGLWPIAEGGIAVPEGQTLLFLPQKPYMPLGTLAEAAVYPKVSGGAVAEAVEAVGLPRLVPHLDKVDDWARILSLGEQQRLAFARALVAKPDWLFLDEATSSLDEEAEQAMYRLMRARFPEITIISIGHRNTLPALHERVITLKPAAAD